MKPVENIPRQFFDVFINDFGRELNNITLKELTSNSALIGSYAECIVRKMIRRVINFARISTGSILSLKNIITKELRQIDTIIWLPTPLPASFDAQEFAIVSRSSVLGILEIKSSNYAGATAAIIGVIDDSIDLIPSWASIKEAKGIICMKTRNEALLDDLENKEKVFVLSELKNHQIIINPLGTLRLLNYLVNINKDSISESFYHSVRIEKYETNN